jgi:benzoylformate decarboxylase
MLNDALAFAQVAKHLPGNAIVVEEAPTSRAQMQDQLRLDRADCFYTTASGGLGYGMPAAVGIALARPESRVVALIGDGSSMYAIQALFSAQSIGANITFIILNNRRYEALRMFGRTFGMNQVVGTDLSGLDFVALAQGHGVTAAWRCKDADQLDQMLTDAFGRQGPSLIEIALQDG